MIEQLRAEIEQLKRRGGAAPFSQRYAQTRPPAPGAQARSGLFPVSQRAGGRGGGNCRCAGRAAVLPGLLRSFGEGEAGNRIDPRNSGPAVARSVMRYAVEIRDCRECGKRVRGQHPDIAPGQHGATAHRIGPRVKALAHILHYVHGVPVRKTPAIPEDLTGVRLTQGAITQNAFQQAEGAVGERYQALRASVREQAVVHTDDTGWRVGGEGAFLMAFVNPTLSVYQVRSRHRNEEVRELVPADFGGVMVCDRGRSYDAVELEGVAQQKCLAHLICNAAKVAEEKNGRARRFAGQFTELLRRALRLSAASADMTLKDYCRQATALYDELTSLLRDRRLRDPDNQRLLNGAGAQQDRGSLLALPQPRWRGAYQQSGRTGSPACGDCPQGLPLLEESTGSRSFRSIHQRPADHPQNKSFRPDCISHRSHHSPTRFRLSPLR